MYREYKDRVEFFVVYIEEAHASDLWQMQSNIKDQVVLTRAQNTGRAGRGGVVLRAKARPGDSGAGRRNGQCGGAGLHGLAGPFVSDRPRGAGGLQEQAGTVRL